jgi:hypothetical protein
MISLKFTVKLIVENFGSNIAWSTTLTRNTETVHFHRKTEVSKFQIRVVLLAGQEKIFRLKIPVLLK